MCVPIVPCLTLKIVACYVVMLYLHQRPCTFVFFAAVAAIATKDVIYFRLDLADSSWHLECTVVTLPL